MFYFMPNLNRMLKIGHNVFQLMDSFQDILIMAGQYDSKIKACIYVFKFTNTTHSNGRLNDRNTK